MSINYTEEGQSVGSPYTVLSLNNCLLEHMSVYGRVAPITLSHPTHRLLIRCVGSQHKALHTKETYITEERKEC